MWHRYRPAATTAPFATSADLTFACVLYQGGNDIPEHSRGIFNEVWVDRLYRGIRRFVNRNFRFVCFVDRDDYQFQEPVETKRLWMSHRNMLSLLEPFREDMGRVIFMGLDTIIVGPMDSLLAYDGPFAMLRDPYKPEIGCSGVMSFPYTPSVWAKFSESGGRGTEMFGHPSDMGFLNTVPHEYLDDHGVTGIYSYKAHIRQTPAMLQMASIVYFHGRLKPHELDLGWVRRYWGEPLV